MDIIRIENLEVFARHGVMKEEQSLGQKFLVSARLYMDISRAGRDDDLDATVNYGEVCQYIGKWMSEHVYKLIESVAQKLAEDLLERYELLTGIEVEIKKPWAPVNMPLDTVSVSTERKWHRVYLAVGSNMGDKEAYLTQAKKELSESRGIRFKRMAPIIKTKPYGGVEQDDFLNSAIEIETWLRPYELLDTLHEIESHADRERKIHWGPRTLDLDILLYDELVMSEENLTIPHADMKNRTFVLEPLSELAPNLIHPVYKMSIKDLLDKLNSEDKNF